MRAVPDCPTCGGSHATPVALLDEQRRRAFLEFDRLKYGGLLATWIDAVLVRVLTCMSCGHAWYGLHPEPEQLSLMYAAGRLLDSSSVPTNVPSVAMQREMRRVRRLFKATNEEPLLLDYGSGRGRWARAAVQEGFRVTAYEPSVERGREADPPFRLVHSEEELTGNRFDVINLEQVLEHVADPLKQLRSMRAYCHENTLVRVTVPNILRCEEGRDIWRLWPFDGRRTHIMAPFEHLHGFTPRSLRQVVHRAGFELLRPAELFLYYPLATMRFMIGRWLHGLDQTFVIARPAQD